MHDISCASQAVEAGFLYFSSVLPLPFAFSRTGILLGLATMLVSCRLYYRLLFGLILCADLRQIPYTKT